MYTVFMFMKGQYDYALCTMQYIFLVMTLLVD
jgi:hypothetical protein